MQHINNPPDDIRELIPDIDDRIAETIMHGLKSDPYHRWASTAEMLRSFKLVHNQIEGIEEEPDDHIEEEVSQDAGFDQFAEEIGLFDATRPSQDKIVPDWTSDEPPIQKEPSFQNEASIQEDEYEDIDQHFEIDDDDDDDDEYETV